jgi:hypothetical protein
MHLIFLHLKKRQISNTICEAPFLQSTYLVLQNINDVVDIIDGVVIDDDQRSQLTKQSSMTNVK